ncbi:MAG: FAD-binding protein [Clostridiales bacterium]|nr:MAG: FAD-binding protein [Clostridiales bacterium]
MRVETKTENDVIISVGKGAVDFIDGFKSYADKKTASVFGVSRPVVDTGKAPYDCQIGLTGKKT